MAVQVFPPRNLPGLADKWGRDAETRIQRLETRVEAVAGSSENDGRATSGQLAVMSQSIDSLTVTVAELSSRTTHSTSPGNLQLIKGSGAGEVGPVSQIVEIAPPLTGPRNAIIYGSGSVAWTGTPTSGGQIAEGVTVGIEFRQDGVRKWYDTAQASSAQLFSFMGSETFSLALPVQVSTSGSTFDLRMWVGKTSAGGQVNAGARLENMNFTISYGNRA